MAIEIITENHGSEIKNILNTLKNRVLIISPFLGMKTCEELSNIVDKNKLVCKVITRFYREDFIQNASSLDGLLCLLESGAELRSLIGLHTKLYIFDDTYSIITSANYTYGGLYSNIELGIKIDNEFDINIKCEEYFNSLWNDIEIFNSKNNNKAVITKDLINNEKKVVNIAASGRTSSTNNFNKTKQGAVLDKVSSTDIFEKALIRNSQGNSQDDIEKKLGGWLKFVADAKHRHDPNIEYFERYNLFSRTRTFFPTRPVGIRLDDRIFLALISFDNDNVPAPIIMGRAFSNGYNENNIANSKIDGWENWMADYPYYIELKNMEIINGPVKNGISLLEMYRKLKGNFYPSTFGLDYSFEKIRTYHYQKDKIRISKYAEEYLNKELDKKFKTYGKANI
jgi:hypothetical protein